MSKVCQLKRPVLVLTTDAGIVKTWEIEIPTFHTKVFFILLFVHHFFSETGLNLTPLDYFC